MVSHQPLAHSRVFQRDARDNDRLALVYQESVPGEEALCREAHLGGQFPQPAFERNPLDIFHECASKAACRKVSSLEEMIDVNGIMWSGIAVYTIKDGMT